ncbi:MAG: LamG-like jellyroll fold domain-containing protein, partial [Pseudomonadota bacterium]
RINHDSGNDTYLLADNGGAIVGGLGRVTVETSFSFASAPTGSIALLSYAEGSNDEALGLFVNATGQLLFTADSAGSAQMSAGTYTQLFDGNRHHLAVSWDNTNGAVNFYIDGVLEETFLGYQTTQTIGIGGTLVLGNDQDSPGGGFSAAQAFSGTLYDLRIFDDVRTAVEIATNYRSDVPFDEPNLRANWQFNALSSDQVITDTVAGNNLSVQHATGTGFVSNAPELSFTVNENAMDGTVVGQVTGIDAEREALIGSLLAIDPELRYNAETEKFYKVVGGAQLWSVAKTAAESTGLNGVNGQLATIRSAGENEFVRELINTTIGYDAWIGGTDGTVEGEWRWVEGGSEADQFWQGDETGFNTSGAYHNFASGQPNDAGGNEDVIHMDETTGLWSDADHDTHNFYGYVIEWRADSVLDATQALTYSIVSQTPNDGAFAIDSSTGQITVANGAELNFEDDTLHTVRVAVTDVNSNTYEEDFVIQINNLVEGNDAPTDLSSGIELNTDGGNDAYLISSSGLPGSLTATTVEIKFAANDLPMETVFMSFNNSASNDELSLQINDPSNSLEIDFGPGSAITVNSIDYRAALVDGEIHSLAVSWDSTHGDWAVYIDGNLIESGTGFNQGVALDTTNGQFVFGQEQDGLNTGYDADQYFSGTYYDVRIWDNVRSEAEIALNYQSKLDLTTAEAASIGLVANWQMDGFNGSNQIVDIVSESGTPNRLSIAHASGAGFTTSVPVEDLHILENAANGTSVGYVMPAVPDGTNDVATDGLFLEAADPGSFQSYTSVSPLGNWSVEAGQVVLAGSVWQSTPLGGRSIELAASVGGTITQDLTTVVGQTYQILFVESGDWTGDSTLGYRVSAGGNSQDFVAQQPDGWSYTNMLWTDRSVTFTATDTTTTLSFASLEAGSSAAVIGDIRVVEVPDAVQQILNNDVSLSYNAATDKFYRLSAVSSSGTNIHNTVGDAIQGGVLNGVVGNLATIRSDAENDFLRQMLLEAGETGAWIGATDSASEGSWTWEDGSGDTFYSGGSAAPGFYENFGTSEPNGGLAENYGELVALDGAWNDLPGSSFRHWITEWDASEVLSNFTFAFSVGGDAGGRFAIDSSSGEITVADGSLLDYETNMSHDVTVEVTDAAGNIVSEMMTIQIDNRPEVAHTVPGALSIAEDSILTFSSGTSTEVSVGDTVGSTDVLLEVSLSVNNGVLNLSGLTGITIIDGADGSNALTINGTESNINAALDGMTFTSELNFNGSVTLEMSTALSVDLSGHYTFDSATVSGSTVNDQATASPHNGTLNGGASIFNDPIRGDVLSLDGAGDFVQINGLIDQPSDVTLSAWIDATSTDTFGAVVISMGLSPALYLEADGRLTGYYESGGANNEFTTTESILNSGWRHVALTIDGATQEIQVYLDGQLVGAYSGSGPIEYDNSPNTYIGRAGNGLTGFDFGGSIDEARIYGRALSVDEIAVLASDRAAVTNTVAISVDSENDAPTFDVGDGVSLVSATMNGFGDSIVQPDGKIVVLGRESNDFSVRRFNVDGSLDTSFGTAGVITFDVQGSDEPSTIALQPDGKILVGGYC